MKAPRPRRPRLEIQYGGHLVTRVCDVRRHFGPASRRFGTLADLHTPDDEGDQPPYPGQTSSIARGRIGARAPEQNSFLEDIMDCSEANASRTGKTAIKEANIRNAGSTSDRVMLRKNLHLRRQRAANACIGCHSRKVRCDAVPFGSPCTNCKRDSKPCRMKESNRGAKKERSGM